MMAAALNYAPCKPHFETTR